MEGRKEVGEGRGMREERERERKQTRDHRTVMCKGYVSLTLIEHFIRKCQSLQHKPLSKSVVPSLLGIRRR